MPTRSLNGSNQASAAAPSVYQPWTRKSSLRSNRASASMGLRAQYFDNANLTNLKLTRTDATVNFDWGKKSPAAKIAANTFSVRWSGKVKPRYSELYTFSTRVNDGARLWVNGEKLIDQWQNRSTAATYRGKILLKAGEQYDIKLEYYENIGEATAKLFWSSPQQSRQIIPRSRLSAQDVTSSPPTVPTAPIPAIRLSRYVGGLTNPTDLVNAGDGSNQLYAVEQAGQIRVLRNGAVQETPFLDIRDRVKSGGEEGLLSLAFSPNYATTRQFYVYYTNKNSDIVLSRFQLKPNGEADPNSETLLLTAPHPVNTNHNGGKLAFGKDGYLYASIGDGGGAGDPNNNAQNPASLLGKILRLDVESPGVNTYAVPSTNPFLAATDPTNRYRDEIWALGLRNPWRITFDRQTSDLYIADVGQGQREEVNFQSATSQGGENYGWKILEGTFPYSPGNSIGFTAPIAEYSHSEGLSVTGGYVYRGSEYPTLQGTYFYGDFANGKIWGLRRTSIGTVENKPLLDTDYGVSTFGEDEQGNIYVADYFTGDLYKLDIA